MPHHQARAASQAALRPHPAAVQAEIHPVLRPLAVAQAVIHPVLRPLAVAPARAQVAMMARQKASHVADI